MPTESNDSTDLTPKGKGWKTDKELPIRVTTMIASIGVFIIFSGIIVMVAAVIVNRMKDQMVTAAHEEVHVLAKQSVQEIEQLISDYESAHEVRVSSMAEVAADPEIRAQLRLFSTSGEVLLSTMVDAEGHMLYQEYGDDDWVAHCPERDGRVRTGVLANDMTYKMEFRDYPEDVKPQRVAIRNDDRILGFLEYGLERDMTLESLAPISAQIESSLMWMVMSVLFCLALAIIFLSMVAMRVMSLQRRHTESMQLAKIGTMASGLAHEIRNPLHAMNLHLEAANDELENPREGSEKAASNTITNVQRQIQNLNSILSSFMDFANPGTVELEPQHLHTIVKEVAGILQPEFDAKGVELQRDDIPDEAWVTADATAIRQVLTNVLLNALQFTEKAENKLVVITGRKAETGRWKLSIEDSGPGIEPGQEEEIFDVFVSGRKGGTGFGLAVARRIMEAIGGTITAANRKEGGAAFHLSLVATKKPDGYQSVMETSNAGLRKGDDGELYIG